MYSDSLIVDQIIVTGSLNEIEVEIREKILYFGMSCPPSHLVEGRLKGFKKLIVLDI